VTIYFPIANEVYDLEVAVQNTAKIAPPNPYKYEKPVLFYGSSITHGFAASRPGMTYSAQVGRMLKTDIMNFGFSGNAKGEPALAEFFATLPMSAFVLDYDHNAPSVEHLINTHYAFYEIIRKANPLVPIIFVTQPDAAKHTAEFDLARKDVIMKTISPQEKTEIKTFTLSTVTPFLLKGIEWIIPLTAVIPMIWAKEKWQVISAAY
jgi:hypothetical protein